MAARRMWRDYQGKLRVRFSVRGDCDGSVPEGALLSDIPTNDDLPEKPRKP